MSGINIIVGQTSSLPKDIIDNYSLTSIPFVIDWPADKDNLEPKSIFQKMADAEAQNVESLPQTSHPAPWLFKKFFEEKLQNSDYVIFISISSRLSATYGSALAGKEMLSPQSRNRIFVVDSQNVSAGEGLVAIKAAELVRQGKKINDILKELEDFRRGVQTLAYLKDLKWIERGKRLKGFMASALEKAKTLGVNPVFGVKSGQIAAVDFNLGKSGPAEVLFKSFKKNLANKEIKAAIAHAQNEEAAEDLKKLLQKEPRAKLSFMGPIDNIIGIHTGPGALILSWHEKTE